MTRLIVVLSLLVVVCAVVTVVHRHDAAGDGSRSLPLPAVRVVAGEVSPQARLGPLPRSRRPRPTCTARNWRSKLKPAERWIDYRESHLNPLDREPTTGAYGLGQLLPQTYRLLGLPMSADPCDQIKAQRAYLKQHYGGSWAAALRHKQQTGWW